MLAYVTVLGFALSSARGLFGLEPTSFPVIWLIFMGAPWSLSLAVLPASAIPEGIARVFVAVMPLFNIWLLSRACRKRRRRRRSENVE